jgi:hypothetical protein
MHVLLANTEGLNGKRNNDILVVAISPSSCRDFSRCGLGGRRFTFLARYDFTARAPEGAPLTYCSPPSAFVPSSSCIYCLRIPLLPHGSLLRVDNSSYRAPIALRIHTYVTPAEPS